MRIEKAFTFRQMPSGRHAFALSLMATLARNAGLPQTADRADRAVAQAYETLELEQLWSVVRANKSRARGDAQQIDRLIDEQIAALHQKLQADTKGDAKDPHVIMAKELIKQLFPEGVRAVTQQATEIQHGDVDIILKRLDTEFAQYVQDLQIERQVERIRTYNDALHQELALDRARRVNHPDVLAAQKRLHACACRAVATLFLELDSDDPATTALHTKILAPFTDQQHRVYLARARNRSRKVADVNPTTGEEIPLPEEEQNPQPAPNPGA